jgi:DNA-directed RNA polymerase subunit E'/Rpb7
MFYIVELNKELEVHPRFFGPKLRSEIDRRLKQEASYNCAQTLVQGFNCLLRFGWYN